MTKKYLIAILAAVVIAAGTLGSVAIFSKGNIFSKSLPASSVRPLPVSGPSLKVYTVKSGKKGEQIQKDVTIEEYAAKDGLLKTYAKSSESPDGKVVFDKNSLINYDYFYFIGRGADGTTYGGAYTDKQGCNNIELSVDKDNSIVVNTNMQAGSKYAFNNTVYRKYLEAQGFTIDTNKLSVTEWKLYPVNDSHYYQNSQFSCPKPKAGPKQDPLPPPTSTPTPPPTGNSQ